MSSHQCSKLREKYGDRAPPIYCKYCDNTRVSVPVNNYNVGGGGDGEGEDDEYYRSTYKSKIKDSSDTPMMKRLREPLTPEPRRVGPRHYNNKRHEFSFIQGLLDETNMPIYDDDYYGYLGSLGFYDNTKLPRGAPLTHDTNTTTALHFYDTKKQKTPIDRREDSEPNLAQVALDIKNSELYNVQDFSETSAKRIKEKTHRILNDPDRKIQSQMLIDIQRAKAELLNPKSRLHPVEKLVSYDAMNLNVNILLLDRITDVLDYQEKIYSFNKYEVKPYGVTFYAELTLKNGAPATKLDFTDQSKNINVPSGSIMYDYPSHNLLSLEIIFDTGNQLFFATNKPGSSLETTVKLTNAVLPNNYTLAPGQFTIKSLNLRADGGSDATVRLIGLF